MFFLKWLDLPCQLGQFTPNMGQDHFWLGPHIVLFI